MKNKPNVVVIGGGTGSFTLLQGLKEHTPNLTALVGMSDDGGSTGILRDELGVLPPGDIRQCLVALSDSQKLRQLFTYRFKEGALKGHSFGNLFLSAVEKMTDSFEEAVAMASDILHITGTVIPVTTTKSKLVLRQTDGETIIGEHKIGNVNFLGKRRPEISLEPAAELLPAGAAAIMAADIVVIAPGNLYGSLAPPLVVGGMKQTLTSTKAKVIYVCNLVTKPNQTDGFTVEDYAEEVERFIGAPTLDFVIYNTDEPAPSLLDKYTHEGEKLVQFNLDSLANRPYRAIGTPIIAKKPVQKSHSDAIADNRSLIRHNAEVTAELLIDICNDQT